MGVMGGKRNGKVRLKAAQVCRDMEQMRRDMNDKIIEDDATLPMRQLFQMRKRLLFQLRMRTTQILPRMLLVEATRREDHLREECPARPPR